MKNILKPFFFIFIFLSFSLYSQEILPPEKVIGESFGSQFSYHSDIEKYSDYILKTSPDKFKRLRYGKTPEGRELFLMIYASKSTLENLESIRANHLINAGLVTGLAKEEKHLIYWLGYNIHGDEGSGSEVAMKFLHHLSTIYPPENQIIIIDPNQNPDGRERYVSRFRSLYTTPSVFDRNSATYNQEWPEGRFNHYLSDLNRDWVWQKQSETIQRMSVYHDWMPHIHADFHEMEAYKTYFFPPSAEPIHEVVNNAQSEQFQRFGQSLESFFNQKNWAYFTKREFDLLYPSYADSYATFNGALGLTFEQGGSGEAGVFYVRAEGDTLTLNDRIEKHFEVSKKLISHFSSESEKIIKSFQKYYNEAQKKGVGKFDSYLIKRTNDANFTRLLKQLELLRIEYKIIDGSSKVTAYSFSTKKNQQTEIEKGDLWVSTKQGKGHLVSVLFEPASKMDDVKTYDISGWSLPYLFHLPAFGLNSSLHVPLLDIEKSLKINPYSETFKISYNSAAAVHFLSMALQKKYEVYFRASETPAFLYFNQTEDTETKAFGELSNIANAEGIEIENLSKREWKTLKNEQLSTLNAPKVGLIIGQNTKEAAIGDCRYFFEKEIYYPFTQLWIHDFPDLNPSDYDVLIFADGKYEDLELNDDRIKRWLADGGKMILLENGLELTDLLGIGNLKKKNLDEIHYSKNKSEPQNLVQGAIFKLEMNKNSFLSHGLPDGAHIIVNGIPGYEITESKTSFASGITSDHLLSGYMGEKAATFMNDSFIAGSFYFGDGVIHQMAFNPLFRNILVDGQLIMGNAIFFPHR